MAPNTRCGSTGMDTQVPSCCATPAALGPPCTSASATKDDLPAVILNAALCLHAIHGSARRPLSGGLPLRVLWDEALADADIGWGGVRHALGQLQRFGHLPDALGVPVDGEPGRIRQAAGLKRCFYFSDTS